MVRGSIADDAIAIVDAMGAADVIYQLVNQRHTQPHGGRDHVYVEVDAHAQYPAWTV